jgi:hypothetical protein
MVFPEDDVPVVGIVFSQDSGTHPLAQSSPRTFKINLAPILCELSGQSPFFLTVTR